MHMSMSQFANCTLVPAIVRFVATGLRNASQSTTAPTASDAVGYCRGGEPLAPHDCATHRNGHHLQTMPDQQPPRRKNAHTPPPGPSSAHDLLKPADVARRLSTSTRQLWNMSRRGQFIAPLKIAGLGTRYRASDVEAWLAGQAAGTAT